MKTKTKCESLEFYKLVMSKSPSYVTVIYDSELNLRFNKLYIFFTLQPRFANFTFSRFVLLVSNEVLWKPTESKFILEQIF